MRAARLLGFSDAVYRNIGDTREPTEQRGYDRTLCLIRAELPEERIAGLMAQGAKLDQDAAVAEAMAVPQPANAGESTSEARSSDTCSRNRLKRERDD